MLKIGILELEGHYYYLTTLFKIINQENCKVTLFSTRSIVEQFYEELGAEIVSVEVVLKDDTTTVLSFLKKVEKICNKEIDILFVNTIMGKLGTWIAFLTFNPKCIKVLTLHNLNSWFSPKLIISFVANFESIARKIILKRFNAISVLDDLLKNYVLSETNYRGKVITIPFSYFDEQKYFDFIEIDKYKDCTKFIIPGSIAFRRRNYHLICDVFEDLFKLYDTKIELILAGRPIGEYGTSIIERAKKFKQKGFRIVFFEEWISPDSYFNLMINSDFILSPIRSDTTFYSQREIYGKTKASGAPFEAIKFAKPLIVPTDFEVIPQLKTSVLNYSNLHSLLALIKNLMDDVSKVEYLKLNALINSKKFTLDNLQSNYRDDVLKKLNIL